MNKILPHVIYHLQHGDVNDWSEFGHIKAVQHENFPELWILSYTAEAQYVGEWTEAEQICRGLILNRVTGEVVARPFDKFFNWLEKGRATNAPIRAITEKMDGSLGIAYRTPVGDMRIATRGSFHSWQADWATDELNNYYPLEGLPENLTLLFEIIGPNNRIVVKYPYNHLILIGVRDRFTGRYLPYSELSILAEAHDFTVVEPVIFNNVFDILRAMHTLPADKEGWVVEFGDGQRFKFKGDQYVNIHRILSKLTWGHFLSIYGTDDYIIYRASVPDEFMEQVLDWETKVERWISKKQYEIISAWKAVEDISDRKEFALKVLELSPTLSKYLFAAKDGKSIRPLILQALRRELDE